MGYEYIVPERSPHPLVSDRRLLDSVVLDFERIGTIARLGVVAYGENNNGI